MSPTPKHSYTKEALLAAIKAVNEETMSLNKASQVFKIPYSTLGDKVRGRRPVNIQPRTLLAATEETRLVDWLKECARRGFGKSKNDVKDCVKSILDARGANISADNRPSKQWVKDFFKRHPDLSVRTPSALGKERALVTQAGLAAWFDEMKEYLDKIDPTLLSSPDRLYNADETGFSLCPKPSKVIAQRGTKHVYSLSSNTKQSVTVLAACSATGHYVPPFIIFPYRRKPCFNLLEDFEEAHFNITPNGWITAEVFITWMRDCFVPAVADKPKPIVLFVDGHASHTSTLEVVELCMQNKIIMYCLKSHASHLIQPLDQAVFGTMKSAWQEQVKQVQHKTGESVSVRTFAKNLKPVWNSTIRPELAFNGFAKSGIYPFNPSRVLSSDKLCPSKTFVSHTTAPSPNAAVSAAPLTAATERPLPIATATAPPPLPPQSGTDIKVLLDFTARIGPERLDYLWDELVCDSSRPTDSGEDLKKFKSLLEKVGFDASRVNSNYSVNTTATCSSSITQANNAETTVAASISTSPTTTSATVNQISQATVNSNNSVSTTATTCSGSITQADNCETTVAASSSTSPTTSLSLDHIFSMPQFPKSKSTRNASSKSMPMALSGVEFGEFLMQKQKAKDDLAAAKEQRKALREENRKRKLQEQQERRKRVEENKRIRLQKKEEREAEKKRRADEKRIKALLQSQQQDDEDDSESDCDIYIPNHSDSECDDVELERQDVCKGCDDASDGVRVMCAICDGWWHTRCTKDATVMNKSTSELEDVEFFCSKCV